MDRNVRRDLKSNYIHKINDTLSNLYDGDTRKNNSLIEHNTVQYKRLKDYCVHLSNISADNINFFNILYKIWKLC